MPEPVEGQFIARIVGRKLTAERYHLYRDCNNLGTFYYSDMYEILDVTDEMIDLCQLHPCRICARRSEKLLVGELIEKILSEGVISGDEFIERLLEGGFAIERK